MTTTLKLDNIAFAYAKQHILRDITLEVKTGEIGCLLGPSGCGKSTLLRLIAGFEQPLHGEISIADQKVADPSHQLAPQNRQVGMLFQDLALFPHLTVAQNITFGLHQLTTTAQQQRTDELLQLCRLDGFQSRYPHQLSGGQRQRVALARAMAPRPKLILLDEPFSSVETGLQSELVHEVKSMLKADQSTALWVTHSLEEAFAVADRMGVMLGGSLLQWSTPDELYHQPNHPDVVRFLNHACLLTGTITSQRTIKTPIGTYTLSNPELFQPDDAAMIAINRQHLQLADDQPSNATVTSAVYQGGGYLISCHLDNQEVMQFQHNKALAMKQPIHLRANPALSYRAFHLN